MGDQWMTYAELGSLMGCSAEAARARAVRRRWRRQAGNDGTARVLVPSGEDLKPRRTGLSGAVVIRSSARSSAPTSDCATGREADALAKLEKLQAEMVEMAQKLGASNAELASARTTIDELRADRGKWQEMAERLSLASSAADREMERARSEAEKARSEAERARSDAERARSELAAYRARPWWRRAFG